MEKSTQEEIELKLRVVLPEEWGDIHAFISAMDNQVKQEKFDLAARYFDTVDRHLRREKIAYRVRKENEKWIATIKTAGSQVDGLHRRIEWNVEVKDGKPDVAVFSATSVDQAMLAQLCGKQLCVLVETVFTRKIILLKYGHSLIEVALDDGMVLGGGRQEKLLEIELELKEGCKEDLLRLGAEISHRFSLVAEPKSKFLRGLLLAGEIRTE